MQRSYIHVSTRSHRKFTNNTNDTSHNQRCRVVLLIDKQKAHISKCSQLATKQQQQHSLQAKQLCCVCPLQFALEHVYLSTVCCCFCCNFYIQSLGRSVVLLRPHFVCLHISTHSLFAHLFVRLSVCRFARVALYLCLLFANLFVAIIVVVLVKNRVNWVLCRGVNRVLRC